MSNRAVSFNEQLNVVGIPAREGILSSDDENTNDDNNEAKAYYKKCFRRGERGMSPEISPKASFDDDHQPSLGDTLGGGGSDAFGFFPVSSGTWSTDMVPEFMVSSAASLAEYRRVSIDDRADWSAKAQQNHHRPSFDASSTQQDLTSTGGRSSQGISSAGAHSDMRWSHYDSANILVTPSPTNKRRGSSNNSSLGGNPLDDDNDTALHEQQLPTGSNNSKVHFLVSEDEREDRLLRLDPISTTGDNSPAQETSNPLEYSSPKTVLDVSGPSIDVPDVSGSSWSEEHWCGPIQKVHTLPQMATTAPPSVDILERSDDDEDAMGDDGSCHTSGVVEVPMMCSSSLSPSRLSPQRQ